jgi:hypothetical protein
MRAITVMRPAVGQNRALDRIEKTLLADDLRLCSLFAVFTRLTLHEVMPATEQITAGRRKSLKPALAISITLIIFVGMLMLASSSPSTHGCGVIMTPSAHGYLLSQTPGCPRARP